MKLKFKLNGKLMELEVSGGERVLDLLRERLDLVGTKEGCGKGECGSCTILLDGEPVCSCLLLSSQVAGREILTIEGLAEAGKLHPVQQAFVDIGAVQCGFCTPGVVLSAVALLKKHRSPSRDEIKLGLAGNLCRCTGYEKILDAVELAAENMAKDARWKLAEARRGGKAQLQRSVEARTRRSQRPRSVGGGRRLASRARH